MPGILHRMATTERRSSQLLRGVLDLCLLAVVADEPAYGYEMTKRLRSRGLSIVGEGSIYPLLGRLERDGLVDTYRAASDGGPPRKYTACPNRDVARLRAASPSGLPRATRSTPCSAARNGGADMTFVDDCRREWKRLRVPDAVANEMAAELTADLEEAALEGASPEDVLGYAVFDARAFAAQWAEERGVVGPEPAPRRRLVPLAFVIALGLFLVITVAGVALLVDGGHFASARVAVGTNFPAPRIRKLLVPPPVVRSRAASGHECSSCPGRAASSWDRAPASPGDGRLGVPRRRSWRHRRDARDVVGAR